jgi:predicted membrane chloride channel (bestrophin family)
MQALFDLPGRFKRLRYEDDRVCVTPTSCFKILRQPRFWIALAISIPCGIIGALLKWAENHNTSKYVANILVNNSGAYAAITFFLGFLIAFRVNSAYQRFWQGCDLVNNIAGEFFNGASSAISYCNHNKCTEKEIYDFQHLLVRLLSLLNALIFTELQQKSDRTIWGQRGPDAYEFELIDVHGIDDMALDILESEPCKVEVVYQWIQGHLVIADNKGMFSVGPPIIARIFQEFSTARHRFHEAQKIAEYPFPFPYMAALQLLLLSHWLVTPIAAMQWTSYAIWSYIFSFLATFSIWFFIGVALEMEKPFGRTQNAIDVREVQKTLNTRLLSLLETYSGKRPALKDTFSLGFQEGSSFDKSDFRITVHSLECRNLATKGFADHAAPSPFDEIYGPVKKSAKSTRISILRCLFGGW